MHGLYESKKGNLISIYFQLNTFGNDLSSLFSFYLLFASTLFFSNQLAVWPDGTNIFQSLAIYNDKICQVETACAKVNLKFAKYYRNPPKIAEDYKNCQKAKFHQIWSHRF